ncbi:MAG: C_GCAxxG_C_C family protein [Prevotellaceae bacterium]|nr:C_GCAxxG_C_C family protein [Candidatus Colivivens equi]MCQ2075574.1 C-GCAxxG-C-C family protein [Bacteroidaceae bacterium]
MSEKQLIARNLFLQGFNCSQAVFCAFAQDYGIDKNLALRLSASFGGGIGRMRKTCGAFCGLSMLIGLEKGQTEENDIETKQENYRIVQELAKKFAAVHGSITCEELLKIRKESKISHIPDERNEEYYRKRPCLTVVETAVSLFESFLEESK